MNYYLPEHSETVDDAMAIPMSRHLWDNPRLCAEMAAEHCNDERGGWEWKWPITIAVLNNELQEVGRFSVDREAVPQFHASKIEVPKEVIPF